MRSRVLDCSHCRLQAAGTPGVGSRQATGCGNCRCSNGSALAGMVFCVKSVDKARLWWARGDPFAVAGCRERGQVGLAEACFWPGGMGRL